MPNTCRAVERRRGKRRAAPSGAVASDVCNNKIVAERSYMQASTARGGHLRDVRQRRPAGAFQLRGPDRHLQTGNVMDTAVANCKTHVAAAMDYINANAYSGTRSRSSPTCKITPATTPTTQSPATTRPRRRQGIDLRDRSRRRSFMRTTGCAEYARLGLQEIKRTNRRVEHAGADYETATATGRSTSPGALKHVAGSRRPWRAIAVTS